MMYLVFLVALVSAIELTSDNYDEQTAGKTVFIKHYAPWCGHCKRLKPDWDKLMAEYDGNKDVLVADIDCTSTGGKALCDAHGVRGYPTLKYGDPNSLEDYQGGRTLDDLKSFCAESLGPSCGPANRDLCSEDELATLDGYMALSVEELEAQVAEKNKQLEAAEETFKTEVEKLQEAYQKLMSDKDATIDEVKKSGLGDLKKVLAYKKLNAAAAGEE